MASDSDKVKITGKWEAEWKTNWKEDWKKYHKEKWDKIYKNGEWNKDWEGYWKQFWDKKWNEGDWNKDWEGYWKQFWSKKWTHQNMQKVQPSMGKIMKEMWKMQNKTSKLIVLLASKKDDEKFKEEINDLENTIKDLQMKIDKQYDDLK